MKTEFIRDHKVVKKKIEEVLNEYSTSFKYSYVEKVKIKNRYTKEDQQIKDLYFLAISENSNKPLCIKAYKENNKMYILHDDITHWNMDSGGSYYALSPTKEIYYASFCNPVLQAHIWRNPDNASKFLKGNLTEGNPNDRYRTPDSIAVNAHIKPVITRHGIFLPKTSSFEQIVLRRTDTTEKSRDDLIKLKEIIDKLKNNDTYYALVSKTDRYPLEFNWEIVTEKQLQKEYVLAPYYRKYTIDDVNEIGEIPREDYNICCVGCGSAGANIIEAISRTEYFNKYMLIDFDHVEMKNLRNQPYSRYDVGGSKTGALRKLINDIKGSDFVKTIIDKYENTDFSIFKYKYIISGFDSIECRLGLLELVKNKTIETKYLIDARYDDLSSSLYFIDTTNEEEMKYYEELLKEDKKEFLKKEKKEQIKWELADVKEWAEKNVINGTCSSTGYGLLGKPKNICLTVDDEQYSCGSNDCLECLKKILEEKGIKNEENSCLAVNIIHIYKFTSAWVTAIIRGIETDEKKLATHIEITADPLPNAMIVKR